MKLTELLRMDTTIVGLESDNKEDVIEEMVSLLIKAKLVKNKAKIVKALMDREALGSTGIGQGIAIPHVKTSLVSKPIAALAVSRQGVDFNALDGEPVYIIFLLLSPEDSPGPHLKALAKISGILRNRPVRTALKDAKEPKTVLKIIEKEDNAV